MYIYQQPNCPDFSWDYALIANLLSKVRYMQGHIVGKTRSLGFEAKSEANLEILTLDIVKSAAIEGEALDEEQIRACVARRLGLSNAVAANQDVDGIVDMMLDATSKYQQPLSFDRLVGWHESLFAQSGMHKSKPIPSNTAKEMLRFIDWFDDHDDIDLVLKAAIAHLWFATIRAFNDDNGRITRALSDMLLARSDESSQRFYSMSAQIQAQSEEYHEILKETQKGSLDITPWLVWFLECLTNALENAENILAKVFKKADFWSRYQHITFNDRQKTMLNLLLDGFEGRLTTSKWAAITKCSSDTALRDIIDLAQKDILDKNESGGRSTNYLLVADITLS